MSRLDKYLCKKYDISFGLAQKLIREKQVRVNGNKVDASYKVADGDNIEIFADINKRTKKERTISKTKMEKFLSRIIYEDEDMVAIDKPSGLATQGGSGIDISVDDFVREKKWQLVHRLDKDTSGVLLIAKNNKAAELLTDGFRNKTIQKTYLALVAGLPRRSEGIISIPLRKKLLGKNEKVLPDYELGKEAVTKYKLLESFSDHSLLELSPITGRTHQLRVHCKEIGHPIINDVKYGGKAVIRRDINKGKLCLHSYQIKVNDLINIVTKNNNAFIK
ncbi:MAG: RluA family pseudouridine synthase [Alphaproteobacteria bacterium]|nr:RluA family pseudouridine synthase [Alphaproteobacteria bacterium]